MPAVAYMDNWVNRTVRVLGLSSNYTALYEQHAVFSGSNAESLGSWSTRAIRTLPNSGVAQSACAANSNPTTGTTNILYVACAIDQPYSYQLATWNMKSSWSTAGAVTWQSLGNVGSGSGGAPTVGFPTSYSASYEAVLATSSRSCGFLCWTRVYYRTDQSAAGWSSGGWSSYIDLQ